jgi:hypothetical protein
MFLFFPIEINRFQTRVAGPDGVFLLQINTHPTVLMLLPDP